MKCRTQQETLYEAERCMPLPLRGPVFENLEQIQAWVTDVMSSDWWPQRFHAVRSIEACKPVGRNSVGGLIDPTEGHGQIDMLQAHWCGLFVCHEVAHVVGDTLGSESHDPIFAQVYLELVYRCLGPDSWTELRNLLLRHRVCLDDRCLGKLACTCGCPTALRSEPVFAGTFAAQSRTYV